MIWAELLRILALDDQPIVAIARRLRSVDQEERLNVLIHKAGIWQVAA